MIIRSATRRFTGIGAALATALGIAVQVRAGPVIIDTFAAPEQTIPSITTHQTFGDMMGGMEVTATFSAAAFETVVWVDGGGGAGAAVGPDGDWKLSVAGDTYLSPWTLSYNPGPNSNKGFLTGVYLDGFEAGVTDFGVMFDRSRDDHGNLIGVGTPGSALGRDFTDLGSPLTIFVTYRGAVGVGPNDPVGDLYRHMDVRFLGPTGGAGGLDGRSISELVFRQDTDNPKIVPEPTQLTLAGAAALGLLAFTLTRRRLPRRRE